MSGDFVTAGALGGIRGSLRRVANDLEQQNHAVAALAQQVQIANQWQVKAFNLQSQVTEWKAWGKDNLEGWKKEEQVSADLRQQLAQAQEALRAEKDRGWEELNELNEKYNKLVRKTNKLVRCVNTVKAQPGNAVALITALETDLKAQQG
ncbi:hypothetical protein [Acetobacter papayae]|uniref:hypothetical protein n=1 Tax=Acetobacter papayae TaxID=1076592 RepID=UPI000470E6DE|nr:hypothetical protein [Acetobacter papayae]